jgi:hypothetical protein
MTAALAAAPAPAGPRPARPWWGLAGLALLLVGLRLLAADVPAWNTTWYLFGWYGWLLVLDALLALRGRSWLAGRRRRELPAMMLWSIPFWYLYEAFNLRLQNWYYVFALRDDLAQLLVSLLAFATVFPACLMHAELAAAFWPAGRGAAARRPRALGRAAIAAIALLGVASVAAPLLWPRWAFPLVWGATLWLPELACRRLGAPSTLAELEAGRPQRLLQLLAGGLLAGLVWELLNFWARCKWIYTVPFFDRLKLFEMPLLGFFGFPPLAVGAAATWSLLSFLFLRGRGEGRPPAPRRALHAALLAAALAASAGVFVAVLRQTVESRRPLLGELVGLDAADAARLAAAGLGTPERLERAVARRGIEQVASATGVPASRLALAARHAALALHKGLGAPRARLLVTAGVPRVEDLGRADAAALTGRLAELARAAGLDPPRRAEVEVWVEAARGRDRPRR